MDKPTLRRDAVKRRRCKVAVCLLLLYALIVEWPVYLVAPYWNWPHLPFTAGIGTRLLLVADPQLLGRVNTAPGLFGFIERWDSDRYISKTFALANDYLKPHVVIFLGDLSDEGEFATDDDFRSYIERFFNIFTHIDYGQAIFLPGDNDIGGERRSVGKAELQRFNSYFRNDTFLTYRGIDFIKVVKELRPDVMLAGHRHEHRLLKLLQQVLQTDSDVDGHDVMPWCGPAEWGTPGRFHGSSYEPSFASRVAEVQSGSTCISTLLLSVHLVAEQATGSVEHLELRLGADRRPLRMDLSSGRLHEIRLPPCSYRMGTHWVGFGAAILDPDRLLTYGVLWSPDRLLYLAGYLVVLFVCTVLCLPAVWQLCISVRHHFCPGKPSRFYGGSLLPLLR
ncbi:metallophosphoesterase 1 isoform X2 [Rhipicephalus microplus]|uniref:metallophosphoesterase 1 isoform X2 n=1 Tax=Rhipicephalus microplus TaxID=6941 RepID=UPI003F6C08EE